MRSMEDLPAYSTLEVAKHVTPEDAWLIVGGKVLNVSSWLDEHPGGDVVLLDLAGRDATREFEDVGHSGGARARLDSLVIGTVRPATNEELRISRDGGVSPGKTVCNPSSRVDALNAWMQENLLSMRNVGIIGVAAAALLGTALFLKRHGSGSLYNSRR